MLFYSEIERLAKQFESMAYEQSYYCFYLSQGHMMKQLIHHVPEMPQNASHYKVTTADIADFKTFLGNMLTTQEPVKITNTYLINWLTKS